jgi:Domain of unknown function (DUF5664)
MTYTKKNYWDQIGEFPTLEELAEKHQRFHDECVYKLEELTKTQHRQNNPQLGDPLLKEPSISIKYDAGKPRVDLIPADALMEIGKVFDYGAKKYFKHNWCHGFDWSKLLGAALRHLFAWSMGENADKESGHSHLAHAASCVLMLLSHELRKIGQDDRFKL